MRRPHNLHFCTNPILRRRWEEEHQPLVLQRLATFGGSQQKSQLTVSELCWLQLSTCSALLILFKSKGAGESGLPLDSSRVGARVLV